MTRKEYLAEIEKSTAAQSKIIKVEKVYKNILPEIVIKIISYSEGSIFFDDGWRSLSFSEIIEAVQDLHVDFVELGIIPLVDCGENDFIVYHFADKLWSKFNIVDECVFKKKATLQELF